MLYWVSVTLCPTSIVTQTNHRDYQRTARLVSPVK